MTVLLCPSGHLPSAAAFDRWLVAASQLGRRRATITLPPEKKLKDLGAKLEAAFNTVLAEWWQAARELADGPGVELSAAGTCAGYGSDFGLMLAWSHLVDELATAPERTLVVCDDPWLFRHLTTIPGVEAGETPALLPAQLRLSARGVAAKLVLVARLTWAALTTRRHRAHHAPGEAVILVYGHPASNAEGDDDYFGPMMRKIPGLKRALHTDCGAARAHALARDGRTASLHAWGRIGWTPGLLFVRWLPEPRHLKGRHGWLVRRAAALEGSGGQHAINAWQRRCQEAWLVGVRPRVVAWPWENHGWERAFCRAARQHGVKTIGYQHTVIGPHQLNYSPASNADGRASLPDMVVCDGPAYRDQLLDWGMAAERLAIGGSLRIGRPMENVFDAAGPVFVALSAKHDIAEQQMRAVEAAAAQGFRFIVRHHPMYSLAFRESDRVRRAEGPLAEQRALAAVFYATGTSGLEALLAGLPTFRLLPEDNIAVDVLPAFLSATPVTADGLADALKRAKRPAPAAWERVLAEVDWPFWQRLLARGDKRPETLHRPQEKIA